MKFTFGDSVVVKAQGLHFNSVGYITDAWNSLSDFSDLVYEVTFLTSQGHILSKKSFLADELKAFSSYR